MDSSTCEVRGRIVRWQANERPVLLRSTLSIPSQIFQVLLDATAIDDHNDLLVGFAKDVHDLMHRPTVCPSIDSAIVLLCQELPTSIQCGEAIARRRKE